MCIIVTDGRIADCSKECELIDGIDADYLLADRGYDTDSIIKQARDAKKKVVIAPKRNRKIQRRYDEDIYK